MRTTLTIDDDVAAELERLRRSRDESMKDLVNEALRRGIKDMASPPKLRKPFRTTAVSLKPRISNVDNISEILALAEGDDYK